MARRVVLLPGTAAAPAATYLRPSADAYNSGWTASTPPNLYAMLDETPADDSDFVYTITPGSVTKITLQTGNVSVGHTLRIRAKRDDNVEALRVSLYDGTSTLIQEWTESTLTAAVQQFNHTVTSSGTGPLTVWLTAL